MVAALLTAWLLFLSFSGRPLCLLLEWTLGRHCAPSSVLCLLFCLPYWQPLLGINVYVYICMFVTGNAVGLRYVGLVDGAASAAKGSLPYGHCRNELDEFLTMLKFERERKGGLRTLAFFCCKSLAGFGDSDEK